MVLSLMALPAILLTLTHPAPIIYLMPTYDLGLCWYWQYDADFVQYLEEACAKRSLTAWQIKPANLLEAITELYTGQATFKTLLDRAADDLRFEPVRRFARENRRGQARRCWRKPLPASWTFPLRLPMP